VSYLQDRTRNHREEQECILILYQLQCHFLRCQPTDFAKIALAALYNLASSMAHLNHLNALDCTVKIPKYFISLVNGKTWPVIFDISVRPPVFASKSSCLM